jgi:hypothetical protein
MATPIAFAHKKRTTVKLLPTTERTLCLDLSKISKKQFLMILEKKLCFFRKMNHLCFFTKNSTGKEKLWVPKRILNLEIVRELVKHNFSYDEGHLDEKEYTVWKKKVVCSTFCILTTEWNYNCISYFYQQKKKWTFDTFTDDLLIFHETTTSNVTIPVPIKVDGFTETRNDFVFKLFDDGYYFRHSESHIPGNFHLYSNI